MQLSKFYFVPEAEVIFTPEEIRLLIRLASSHYDAVCRQTGEVGGFLYGIQNRLLFMEQERKDGIRPRNEELSVSIFLKFQQLDILCKILEMGIGSDVNMASSMLRREIYQVLNKMNQESKAKNS